MAYGSLHEADAINWYECERGVLVRPIGFVQHPRFDWCGVSPDGYVDSGRIEIKCPASGIPHNGIPGHYLPQCLGVLYVTRGAWIDFVSWTPERTEVYRIAEDEYREQWADWEQQLEAFWNDFVLADKEPPRKRKNAVTK